MKKKININIQLDQRFLAHLLSRSRVKFTPEEIQIFQKKLDNYIIPALEILDQMPLDKENLGLWPKIPMSTKLCSGPASPMVKDLFALNNRKLTKEGFFLIKNIHDDSSKKND